MYSIHLKKSCIHHCKYLFGDVDAKIRRELIRESLKLSHKEDRVNQCLTSPKRKGVQLITSKTNDLSKIAGKIHTQFGPPIRTRLPASSPRFCILMISCLQWHDPTESAVPAINLSRNPAQSVGFQVEDQARTSNSPRVAHHDGFIVHPRFAQTSSLYNAHTVTLEHVDLQV